MFSLQDPTTTASPPQPPLRHPLPPISSATISRTFCSLVLEPKAVALIAVPAAPKPVLMSFQTPDTGDVIVSPGILVSFHLIVKLKHTMRLNN